MKKIIKKIFLNIARNAILISFFTFFSRFFGLFRDIFIANIFGISYITDSYFIAFSIPNMLRRFIANGAFSVAFVSIYSKLLIENGKFNARKFGSNVSGLVALFFLFLIFLFIFF